MSGRKISELASIEFEGSLGEAFKKYSRTGEQLAYGLAFEYELAAANSQAALARLSGKWLLFGIDSKVRGRLVARRVKRMAELATGMANELRKFEDSYRRQFLNIPRREVKASEL